MYRYYGGSPMPSSEAQRRANAKYQAKTIASLACRVKKEQADKFRDYCARQGKTANAVLKEYVLNCIEENREAVSTDPAESD